MAMNKKRSYDWHKFEGANQPTETKGLDRVDVKVEGGTVFHSLEPSIITWMNVMSWRRADPKKQKIESKPMTDIQETLLERESTHGSYPVQSEFSQDLKDHLRHHRSWPDLAPDQRESLELVCMKMSRIMHGNANELDHWRDIAGYITLVINRMEMGGKDRRVSMISRPPPNQSERRA